VAAAAGLVEQTVARGVWEVIEGRSLGRTRGPEQHPGSASREPQRSLQVPRWSAIHGIRQSFPVPARRWTATEDPTHRSFRREVVLNTTLCESGDQTGSCRQATTCAPCCRRHSPRKPALRTDTR
jgi:hypothetical protein